MIKITHVPKVVYDDKVTYYVPKGSVISDVIAEDIGTTSLLTINVYNKKTCTNLKVNVEVGTAKVDEYIQQMEACLKKDEASISDVTFRVEPTVKKPRLHHEEWRKTC